MWTLEALNERQKKNTNYEVLAFYAFVLHFSGMYLHEVGATWRYWHVCMVNAYDVITNTLRHFRMKGKFRFCIESNIMFQLKSLANGR